MKLTPEESRILKAIEEGDSWVEVELKMDAKNNRVPDESEAVTKLCSLIRKLVKRKAGR